MRQLKIFIPTVLLLTFALSIYIGSQVIAQIKCQEGPFSTTNENPTYNSGWECYYYDYNPPTPFEYDYANSGVTILPDTTTNIYVMGGEPPYIWADPGLGYSWASGITSGVSNMLICAPDTGGG